MDGEGGVLGEPPCPKQLQLPGGKVGVIWIAIRVLTYNPFPRMRIRPSEVKKTLCWLDQLD